jgi:uncharacterized UBP type Zn finger protein
MSVIINGVYRYQTLAVEGTSELYPRALKRIREDLKKMIIKEKLTLLDFEFSERGCWCKVCGRVFNSFDQKDIIKLLKEARGETDNG